MQLLRDDLTLSPSKAGGETTYLVRDPRSGEVFEFGEAEYFLLDAMRRPYVEVELIERFNAAFGFESTGADFQDFLTILNDWGLLQETQSAQKVLKMASGRRRLPPLAAVSQPADALRKNKIPAGLEIGNSAAPEPLRQSFRAQLDDFDRDLLDAIGDAGGIDDDGDFLASGPVPPRSAVKDLGGPAGKSSQHWSWFCPDRLFAGLAHWLYPLHYLVYLIPIFCLLAVAALVFNFQTVKDDFFRLLASINLFEHIAFSIITVALAAPLAKGITARHFDIRVPSFGIRFSFGIIPRFDVIIDDISALPKSARLWIESAPLLARLTAFCIGISVFLMTRPMGTLLPIAALMLASVSLISLLLAANPLLNAEGYRLLTTLLDMPYLRQRANRAFFSLFGKGADTVSFRGKQEDRLALRAFALASFIFLFGVLGLALIFLANWLEWHYQGTGVVIFVVIAAYLIFNFRRQVSLRKAQLQARVETVKTARGGQRPAFRTVPSPMRGPAVPDRRKSARKPRSRWAAALRYLLLALFIGCLFLPYPYETGGSAQVLPVAHHQLYAETDGVVEQVLFDGGEWVNKDTPVAQMANHRQTRDVLTTQSLIQKQKDDIEKLLTTPTKEELDLAVQQLEVARVQFKYSTEKAKRLEKLYASGNISLEDYEKAKGDMDVDKQQVLEKEANLLAVKNQVNPNQIEAARAELKKLQEDLEFYQEELRRTTLRMPVDGRILTMNLKNLRSKYLENGDLFAEVEDARMARIEISIPESDIGEVQLGDRVRLQIWTYPGQFFYGTVSEIYPSASTTDYGNVVQVVCTLPNDKGILQSGMTGYAKVDGSEMFTVEAFTRALVRFFRIEVWSWIP